MLPALIALWMAGTTPASPHQDGLQLYNQHKYAEAIAALEAAAKDEKPDSAEYRESVLLIAKSYFSLKQPADAIPWLEKLPGVNEANYMLGFARLQNGETQNAEAAFARLFDLPANSAAAHLLTAQMMVRAADADHGITEAKAALAIDPNLPGAHFLLAEIELERGSPGSAAQDLNQELAIDPALAMAWFRLGDAQGRLEHWKEAIPNLQRSIWLNPDFSGAFVLLGECYFQTGDFTNAEGTLRKALTLDPASRSANYFLGRSLIALGRTGEGNAILEKLNASQPHLQPVTK